jgi:DNA-binding HxlR family transcriptional regulator
METGFNEMKMRSDCPISYTMELLGNKWTLLILRDIIFNQKNSFGEFLESKEKIASNILASKLASLEAYGFIVKKVSAFNKKKNLYYLTEKAIDLLPMIIEVIIWGAKYNPENSLDQIQKEIEKNKTQVIRKYTEILQSQIQKA